MTNPPTKAIKKCLPCSCGSGREAVFKQKQKKSKLEYEIKFLESHKTLLEKQANSFREYLDKVSDKEKRIVFDRAEISKHSYSLLDIETYLMDIQPIPETRGAWKSLAKELWESFKMVEKWLAAGVSE